MEPARILVVDDTPDVRTLVCRVLVGQGYRVLAADDGQAAMEACEKLAGQIDLLLTDIQMPGMNGVELAGSVVANYPTVRVLFISGQFEESEVEILATKTGFGKSIMKLLVIGGAAVVAAAGAVWRKLAGRPAQPAETQAG